MSRARKTSDRPESDGHCTGEFATAVATLIAIAGIALSNRILQADGDEAIVLLATAALALVACLVYGGLVDAPTERGRFVRRAVGRSSLCLAVSGGVLLLGLVLFSPPP